MTSTTPDKAVSLRGVSKSFREGDQRHSVLDSVDLDVDSGNFIAILGRSGTGKSTLLNLIGGIDLPDAGEVYVAGTPIHAVDERERSLFRRRHIGFVFQFFNLLPTLTVEENVVLPAQLNGIDDGRERAHALLDAVGLADRASSFPDRLSGGEQQRVAIARALVHDPPLLLADEPTGNLDVAVGREILDLLHALAHERGKTLLMATHSHEAATMAERILRVVDHNIIEVSGEDL